MLFKWFLVKEGIKMKTEYRINKWLRVLDMVGMVIGPISFCLPIIFFAIQGFQILKTNSNNYTDFIILFLGTIVIIISLGYILGSSFKRYVCHQATRDEVIAFRLIYSGFILGSLIVYFVFIF